MKQVQDHLSPTAETAEAASLTHSIQAAVRFARIVLYRKEILIVALVISGLLGGLYYATATRIYQSKASLLVLQTGNQLTTEMSGERTAKDLMPTYTSLVSSEAVLSDAVVLLDPEYRVDFAEAPKSEWTRILRGNLSVSAMRGTNIIEIAYRSRDLHAAAAVVDAVLNAYLQFMNNLHKNAAVEIGDILTKQKQSLEKELAAKQNEFVAIRRVAQELALKESDTGTNVVVRRAWILNEALMKAHEKRLEAESRLATIRHAVDNGEDLLQYTLSAIEGVGREVVLARMGMSNADVYTVSRMSQELLHDRAELRAAEQIYGPQHRTIRRLQERIQNTQQYLENRRNVTKAMLQDVSNQQLAPMLLEMAQQELDLALEHERMVHASYDLEKSRALELDESATRLHMVELDLTHLRNLYDAVVERIKDIDLGQDNPMLRTRITSPPEVPSGPSSPRLPKIALAALFLGLLGGLAVIYVLDLLDDRFRSPEEIQAQLGVPVLALVRRLEALEGTGATNIHVHVHPTGAESESFRTLRTALAFIDNGATRLVVSSTEPGDGKTTISVNLAAAVAQSGKRTLLIDADMRRPGLTPMLDLKGQHGLSTLLRDSAPLPQSIPANLVPSLLENLDVISSGPRPVNPMELLAGDRFADLLGWAETVYDQIVIDSPPVLAVSDSAIIGRLVDGVVLAVRPEKNRRRLVVRAVSSFPSLGVRVLGMVINNVEAEKNQTDYGYGYGYGYGYSYGADHEEQGAEDPGQPAQAMRRPRRARAA